MLQVQMRREEFPIAEGRLYFCGHSLGLQPHRSRTYVEQHLEQWKTMGVEGWFDGETPWYTTFEALRPMMGRIVGAEPDEVVPMNSLTVNLHLMLTSFYRPSGGRYKIVTDAPTFPSDLYVFKSQLEMHGHRAEDLLLVANEEELAQVLEDEPVALVCFNGVNYHTGEAFDLARVVQLAHEKGAIAGLDLAHAAGNVPLKLHEWGVDFAVWCHYKYLNSGPGAVGGAFVHRKWWENQRLPRLAGWWGNDPERRFEMHLLDTFEPRVGAPGWALSSAPVLALAALQGALEVYDEVGIEQLRERSVMLTRRLEEVLLEGGLKILTPTDPNRRGAALTVEAAGDSQQLFDRLKRGGVVCDFRPPNQLRITPAPLYNTLEEIEALASIL